MREARNEAAPFALVAAAILVALALVAQHAGWEYLGQPLWWIWLIVAAPYVLLAATLLLGFKRLVLHDRRREIVIGLLAVVLRKPDFQFPQDENPQIARNDWAPRLWDYFYLSLTNATAFSPTDAMPLARTAKALMAAESILSVLSVLLVAARAVNILA